MDNVDGVNSALDKPNPNERQQALMESLGFELNEYSAWMTCTWSFKTADNFEFSISFRDYEAPTMKDLIGRIAVMMFEKGKRDISEKMRELLRV